MDPTLTAVSRYASSWCLKSRPSNVQASHIPPFFVAFCVTPLASNASELVSSLYFASRKRMKNISLTFCQVRQHLVAALIAGGGTHIKLFYKSRCRCASPGWHDYGIQLPLMCEACHLVQIIHVLVMCPQVYGAATMNNTLCLGIFLLLVHVRGLRWEFTSEVIVIIGAP